MKKIFITIFLIITGVCSASAVRYQGFIEGVAGVYLPSRIFNDGPEIGFSTSHGLEIIPGLFAGVGADVLFGNYDFPDDMKYRGAEPRDAYINVFVEGRYRILPLKKISPFVGMRLGAGYGDCYKGSRIFPYLSPALGGSFNFTRKFGMDVSIGYIFHGTIDYQHYVEPFDEEPVTDKIANNSIQLRVGFHF